MRQKEKRSDDFVANQAYIQQAYRDEAQKGQHNLSKSTATCLGIPTNISQMKIPIRVQKTPAFLSQIENCVVTRIPVRDCT